MRIVYALTIAFSIVLVSGLLFAAGKPAAGTHAVIDASPSEALNSKLFGGSVDGTWLGCEKMMLKVKGGERYRLYSPTKYLGEGVGGKAVEADNGPAIDTPEVSLKTTVELPGNDTPVIGICGTWNALPRVPKSQSTKQQVYIDAVGALLKQHGLVGAPVNITKILRIDLEGDGKEEVLISAVTPRKAFPEPYAKKNDYSLVVMRKLVGKTVVTIPIEEQYLTRDESPEDTGPSLPEVFTLDAVLDLNGDGVMEVVTGWRYYEGIGRNIVEIKGTKVEGVMGWGIGS